MELKQIEINYNGLDLQLRVIKNLEALVTDPNDEDQIPCWAEVWPAARALGYYIWDQVDLKERSVLELGSGMGLPGMVAAKKGGIVLLTDYQAKALDLAEENIKLAQLPGISTQLADWRDFTVEGKFDFILASDVLYDPKFFDCLWQIIKDKLNKGGRILISHPGRKDTFKFVEGLKQRSNYQETFNLLPITVDDPLFPHYTIRIHDLQLTYPED